MHIVIMVDSIYPNCTMNGIVGEILQENLNETITMVSYKKKTSKKIIEVNNLNVYLQDIINVYSNSRYNNLFKFLKLLIRSSYYLYKNHSILGLDNHLIKDCIKKLKKLNEENKIDIIISISEPFEFQVASAIMKENNPDIRLISYQLDYFSEIFVKYYPQWLSEKRKKKRISLEEYVLKLTDEVIAIPFLEEKYCEYKDYIDKIHYFDLPLIRKINVKREIEILIDTNMTNLTYAGTLSKHERNPTHLLELFKMLNKENICLNFFHMGDCNEIINQYALANRNIKNYGMVDNETCYAHLFSSNILVAIGTFKGLNISGKIFDYISICKPIIYLYYSEADVNLKYLEKYPLALCIDCSKELESNNLESFILKNRDIILNFDDIEQLYPQISVSKIIDIIK